MWQIEHAKCEDFLKTLPENCIDSLVTDPPYGLSQFDTSDIIECLKCWLSGVPYHHSKKGFMSKKWDSFVPGPEIWQEIYRVMKPGAHGVVFAGTRTVDLMGISLRLAGFEVRDMVAWLYGQGFPKSLDISKTLDKEYGASRKIIGSKIGLPGYSLNPNIGHGIGMSGNIDGSLRKPEKECSITAPATDSAKQWDGWGTALKPALEPILLIRKPISESTVAKNVLKWGTGGINIDSSRIEVNGEVVPVNKLENWSGFGQEKRPDYEATENTKGRWPANVILSYPEDIYILSDDITTETLFLGLLTKFIPNTKTITAATYVSLEPHLQKLFTVIPNEVTELFPQTKSGNKFHSTSRIYGGNALLPSKTMGNNTVYKGSSGSAARFFYCAKTSPKEREVGLENFEIISASECCEDRDPDSVGLDNPRAGAGRTQGHKNFHPTVKPISLMKYLITLITLPNGVVLDPFVGSGSTGCAAVQLPCDFLGLDIDSNYCDIAKVRIEYWEKNKCGE